MSLKARIEAVIYAAEEPVTVAQLATLFRDEALAARAARIAPQADPEAPVDPLESESDLTELDPEPQPAEAAQKSSSKEMPPEANDAAQPSPADEPGSPSGDTSADASAQRAAARALDREIRAEIRGILDELIADYNAPDHGLEIREVAGGFRFGTRPEYHDAVRAFVKSLKPPMKLSLQALETLAVIAYKQPVTAPEIGEIRGVDSGGVLGSLVSRKLITTAGRKQVIGRPILYKTTKEFLLRFGLKDLNELPSIEEFEKMASELAEPEEESAIGALAAAEELPFAQNEIAVIEEQEMQSAGPHDPKEPAPPMNDPEPEVPEPPIGEPPTEPQPAPTSEQDAAAPVEEQS